MEAPEPDAQQLLRGVQRDLGKRLTQLSRAIHQVAAGQPSEGAVAAPADSSATPAAAQDAALQRALQDAAERIRDFQRRAEHQAQQFQLEAVLAPQREQHAAEQACLAQQLASSGAERAELEQRVAELEAAQRAAVEEAAAWQQRALDNQSHLDAALVQHAAEASQLQQALEAAQERELALAAYMKQAQVDAASQATSLQQEAAQWRASAEQATRDLAAAATAWQQEKAELGSSHEQQQAFWAGEVESLRLQCAEARQQAAAQAAWTAAAELQVADLQRQVQRHGSELSAAREEQRELEAAVQAIEEEASAMGVRLRAAEEAAAATQTHAEEVQQELTTATKRLWDQGAQLAAADEAHSHQVKRLEGELAEARAEHASARCTLYAMKQAAAEHERQRAAAEAQQEQLVQELASQKQQVDLLSSQLIEVNAAQVSTAKAAAREHAAAAASAAELRSQLTEAWRAAETAHQAMATVQLGCEAQVHLLQQNQEQQLAAAVADAATQLARLQEVAASALAAREAELQDQLAQAVSSRQKEEQHLREQAAAETAAQEGRWGVLCSQLAYKLQQLAGNLGSDAVQVHLSLDDAMLAVSSGSGTTVEQAAGQGSGRAGQQEDGEAPKALPPPMAAVHAALLGLYGSALSLRSRHGDALSQLAGLQEQLERRRRQLAEETRGWQQRLDQELRQQEVACDLLCSERVTAVEGEWRARLAASEDRLQSELRQVTRTLAAAQHNRQELEQQCSALAAEVLAAQQGAAAGLEAAAARAAEQAMVAQAKAVEAAKRADERQAQAEDTLRQEMQGALARLAEQHASALQAAAVQHQQQLDEMRRLAEQAAQSHEHALKRVEEAWQLKWAAEAARLARMHGDELETAAILHRQAMAEEQQQHGGKVARLREDIANLERSERQLLKARAVLEAGVGELKAVVQAAADTAAAEAEGARMAANAAAAATVSGLQQQVKELLGEKHGLLDQVAELQDRLGTEPRPTDLVTIASLEGQVATLQQQLGSTEQHFQRLRQELLLREEVYNKTFAAGGAATAMSVGGAASSQSTLVDWMIRAAPGAAAGGSGSGWPGSTGATTRLPVLGGRRSSGGRGMRGP